MTTLAELKDLSGLPGPRGNLELLYRFVAERNGKVVGECLECILPDTSNSPEEYAGMCGVVGRAVLISDRPEEALEFLRPHAAHSSWRIREAVAMGIQQVARGKTRSILPLLDSWVSGTALERRAVVAGLAEPVLLGDLAANREILSNFRAITDGFRHSSRLDEPGKVLRQALGYAWSVVVVRSGEEGKAAFGRLLDWEDEHVRWIVRENLSKSRMAKFDAEWTSGLAARAGTAEGRGRKRG